MLPVTAVDAVIAMKPGVQDMPISIVQFEASTQVLSWRSKHISSRNPFSAVVEGKTYHR